MEQDRNSFFEREIAAAKTGEDSVIAILTMRDQCNLNCIYCAAKDLLGYLPVKRMSPETLTAVISGFMSYFSQRNNSCVEFLFHGPEITQDTSLIKQAITLEQQIYLSLGVKRPLYRRDCSPGEEPFVRNTLQTNATLVNEALFAVMKEGDIRQLSISLDGPEDIHNSNRVYRNGRGSYQEVMDSVALAREREVDVAAIAVFTKSGVGRIPEIYNFFKEQRISFKLNPVTSSFAEKHDFQVSPEEYAQAVIELSELYLNDVSDDIRVITIDQLLRVASGHYLQIKSKDGKTHSLQESAKTDVFSVTCGGYMFSIDPLGDVYPCEMFMGNPSFNYGNISGGMKNILSSPARISFIERVLQLPDDCVSCNLNDVCYGGCPSTALKNTGTIYGKDPFCEAYQKIFEYLQNAVLPKN